MVDVTLFEIHLEDASFTANAPFSSADDPEETALDAADIDRAGDDGPEADEDDEEEEAVAAADGGDSGRGRLVLAAVVVVALLYLGRRLRAGEEAPAVEA